MSKKNCSLWASRTTSENVSHSVKLASSCPHHKGYKRWRNSERSLLNNHRLTPTTDSRRLVLFLYIQNSTASFTCVIAPDQAYQALFASARFVRARPTLLRKTDWMRDEPTMPSSVSQSAVEKPAIKASSFKAYLAPSTSTARYQQGKKALLNQKVCRLPAIWTFNDALLSVEKDERNGLADLISQLSLQRTLLGNDP